MENHETQEALPAAPTSAVGRASALSSANAGACDATVAAYTRNLLRGTRLGERVRRAPKTLGYLGISGILDIEVKPVAPARKAAAGANRSADSDDDDDDDRDDFTHAEAAALAQAIADLPPGLEEPPPLAEPLARNLDLLAATFGLDAVERDLLQLLVVYQHHGDFESICDWYGTITLGELVRLLASATCRPREQVMRALSPSGRLCGSGLVEFDENRGNFESRLELRRPIADLVERPCLDEATVLSTFLPQAGAARLTDEDFAHLGPRLDLARQLLGAAIARRAVGVNLLLHGSTGTGKTELARLLSRSLGAPLHEAGFAGDYVKRDATRRLSSLRAGNRLLAGSRALLLFDEMEDVFGGARDAGGNERADASKLWLNRLLEDNAVPTIWISNEVGQIDPAYLRRFTYAIELRGLPASRRARVLSRHAEAGTASEADHRWLAERHAVAPAQLSTAARAASLLGRADRPTLDALLSPMAQLCGVRPLRASGGAEYRLDAAGNPEELSDILAAMAGYTPERGPVSLCLYGPPGTGKTAFVRHLARTLDRPLVERRVSDVMSKWVGETERNIAAAFAEAEADGAVLLFDEADSFLRDRRGAQHAWETSLVNEFLQQMEAFDGVLACTTNLFRELDAASLRRFTFKVGFTWMRPEAALALVEERLGRFLDAPIDAAARPGLARELARLVRLAPGDVAAVERRLRILGAQGRRWSAAALCEELFAEVSVKEGEKRVAGF